MKMTELGMDDLGRAKSILESLTNIVPEKNKIDVLSSRASHVIQSAINLLEDINKYCGKEEAEYLEKKLYNSIKSREPDKFARMIGKFKDE